MFTIIEVIQDGGRYMDTRLMGVYDTAESAEAALKERAAEIIDNEEIPVGDEYDPNDASSYWEYYDDDGLLGVLLQIVCLDEVEKY